MNLPSVQQQGAVIPWRELRLFSKQFVEIGCGAAVAPVTALLFYVTVFLQVNQSPLDRASGQGQVSGDRPDPRPALAG